MLLMTEGNNHDRTRQPDGIHGVGAHQRVESPDEDDFHAGARFPDNDGSGTDFSDALDAGDQGDFEGDYWDAVDSGIFGSLPDDLSLDDEDGPEYLGLARDSDPESLLLASRYSPNTGGEKGKVTREISAYIEDLNPEKRIVFRFLQKKLLTATAKNATQKDREAALIWIFGMEESDVIGFEDSCLALEARPWVVRLRVQLQFWFKNIRFTSQIPALAMPLPSRVAEEAYSSAMEDGIWVARRIWEWPGIQVEELQAFPGAPGIRAIQSAVDALEESGLLVAGFDGLYWYCVGHSPLNRFGRPLNVSWASFWQR